MMVRIRTASFALSKGLQSKPAKYRCYSEVLPPSGCAVEKLFGRASSKPECLALNKGTFLACAFFVAILFTKPQQCSIKPQLVSWEKAGALSKGLKMPLRQMFLAAF